MSTLDNDTALLDRIQRRVLWLAVQQIHHANHVRQTTDRMKVGGHQASCASVVTILTTLFFGFMRQTISSPSSRTRHPFFMRFSTCLVISMVRT